MDKATAPNPNAITSWVSAGLAAQGIFEVKLTWTGAQVNKFLQRHLPRLFEYFTTAAESPPPANQQGLSTLLTILPYAVVVRKGKQLTVVEEFHPSGQTLRDALHNGGESLRRPINIRTIYLGMAKLHIHSNRHHSFIIQSLGTLFLNNSFELCF